jgi:GNAT superfamily N-acetyltransferase
MNIRVIEAGDIADLFDLRAATRESPYSRDDLRTIGITEESTAARLLTTNRGWLCESGGTKVGFAIGDGSTGEICVVAVLPAFEGRGIGLRLLRAVETWLFSLGWKELWLWTSSDPKKRAYSFYKSSGWVVSREEVDVVYLTKKAAGEPAGPEPIMAAMPAGSAESLPVAQVDQSSSPHP